MRAAAAVLALVLLSLQCFADDDETSDAPPRLQALMQAVCGITAVRDDIGCIMAAVAVSGHSKATQLLEGMINDGCHSGVSTMRMTQSECKELSVLVFIASTPRQSGLRLSLGGQLGSLMPTGNDDKWRSVVFHAFREDDRQQQHSSSSPDGPMMPQVVFLATLGVAVWLYMQWIKFLDNARARTAAQHARAEEPHSVVSTPGGVGTGFMYVKFPWHSSVYYPGGMMPFLGMTFCLLISIQYNFESVTRTHCSPIANFMPSISACIGDFAPQKYIWRFFIAAMITQRVMDGLVLDGLLREAAVKPGRVAPVPHDYSSRRQTILVLHVAEQFFLLLLTCISSSDDGRPHQVGFTGFLLCAVARQFMHCRLLRIAYEVDHGRATPMQLWAYQWRCKMAMVNNMFGIGAIVFYIWHNTVCMPFVYSCFATCEWMFVVTNIQFHMAIAVDQPHNNVLCIMPETVLKNK